MNANWSRFTNPERSAPELCLRCGRALACEPDQDGHCPDCAFERTPSGLHPVKGVSRVRQNLQRVDKLPLRVKLLQPPIKVRALDNLGVGDEGGLHL